MKTLKHLLTALFILLSLSAVVVACKKPVADPVVPTPQPVPVPVSVPVVSIIGIDPATAPVGSTIAVNGTNFSTDPASNTITIGGVPATVVSATATRIVVIVPAGAANGPVAVTTGGQTVQSQSVFTVFMTPSKPVVEVSGTTFANQTWTNDNIYLLRGMVYIPANFTLTIAPGTVIKGGGRELDPTGKNMAGTLVIERRAAIIAKGTPAQPIVFTSARTAGQRGYGDWGGLVLVGKSLVNKAGITPSPGGIRGTVELYGEPFDNSGVLQYVRIEYAGATQPNAPDSQFSGLSMQGVGIGTVIDHVQVSYSGGDAFAWFGGTANVKNIVAYYSFDDDWSADWGYSGNVQFGVAVRNPEVADRSGSNGIELENFEPLAIVDVPPVVLTNGLPQNAPVFANMSSFAFSSTPTTANGPGGTGAYQAGLNLRRNAAVAVYNSLYYGYPEGLRLDATGTPSALGSGSIDLRGVVLANVLAPVVGVGTVTNEQAVAYFTNNERRNQIIPASDLASLLLNNFSSRPSFLPQAGSPLLTGAVTAGKLTNPFFTPVTFRGAFGTMDWTTGWTNFNPQNTNYDR